MRATFAIFFGALLLAAVPALAQPQVDRVFELSFKEGFVTGDDEVFEGKKQLVLTVRFTITRLKEAAGDITKDYKIVITENGEKVREVDVPQPKPSEDLAVVLAMDVSGSMNEGGRIHQARAAASVFFNKLPARADCGLILFDHLLRVVEEPGKDRPRLQQLVLKTPPDGGTAYLDATFKAIQMLAQSTAKNKAVVVMTDGVDLNSHSTLEHVIAEAKKAGVRVFTIGIGEPGRNDPVTTVLTLDKSGSMLLPADDIDKQPKIDALKMAAHRFLASMRANARSTVLEFSDQVMVPRPFTGDRKVLAADINNLKAAGETAFLDAAYTAVATLIAANPHGKRAVVLMTDGIDNSSRRRKEEVIKRAKDAGIPLYMLAFGRPGELDRATMEEIAKKTDGEFYHAANEKALVSIFEKLSMKIHDDGVDEVALIKLATQTGGQYYPAKDVNKLQLILEQVTESVAQKDYEIKWPSKHQRNDGFPRKVKLELRYKGEEVKGSVVKVTKEGERKQTEGGGHVLVRGVVVAEINGTVYLVLLVALGVLLALPLTLRRLTRSSTSG
ncbi:MAG TPA: VWA domain-containing protein [Gemmataceae bacterium]|nr:VWA domain-containing protein [Gemmataceae bacterium]